MKSLELFLAFRYLRGSRRTMGGGLTSAIAIAGVTVGVAALIATLAVMTGFREDIRAKILGAQPHLLIQPPGNGTLPEADYKERFSSVKEVVAWSPFVLGQALVRSAQGAQGVVVKGVDPAREAGVTGLDHRMIVGNWAELGRPPAKGLAPPVFLGKELAARLETGLGDRIVLAVSNGGDAGLGALPDLSAFTVAGILETGLYDYDSSLLVMGLGSAQNLFGLSGRLTGLGVRLEDADDFTGPAMKLQAKFSSLGFVRSWLALNRPLFAALRLEKIVMFLILALITLVAAFTILSNLLLVTAQRTREIGILGAMGATPGMIHRIFLLKGLLMGAFGTAAGTVLGLAISGLLKKYEFVKLPADVYYVERLPVRVVPSDVLLVIVSALLIVLIATLYPSRAAARMDTLEAVRQ